MKGRATVWLILALVLVVGSALVGGWREGAEFAGSDSQATAVAAAIRPDYQPWWGFFWEPSPELASGLFALQAALGAGVLGYCLGIQRERARRRQGRADDGD
ncbi:MAG: energy-coupling factor ABC transporter substrate-binding protein [Candidatus Competibacter sp.]|nr:energy-coupling factor ABC transporter substrate-binding protein [Candidatus Competibacter sp.]